MSDMVSLPCARLQAVNRSHSCVATVAEFGLFRMICGQQRRLVEVVGENRLPILSTFHRDLIGIFSEKEDLVKSVARKRDMKSRFTATLSIGFFRPRAMTFRPRAQREPGCSSACVT